MFYYRSGEQVQVGDIVSVEDDMELGPFSGVVVMILEPESKESVDYGCPNGGVMIEGGLSNKKDWVLWSPPDREFWEDLNFIKRRSK